MMYKIMAYETANATEEFQAGNHVVIYCVEKKKIPVGIFILHSMTFL